MTPAPTAAAARAPRHDETHIGDSARTSTAVDGPSLASHAGDLSLMLCAALLVLGTLDVSMPPPPPGMRLLAPGPALPGSATPGPPDERPSADGAGPALAALGDGEASSAPSEGALAVLPQDKPAPAEQGTSPAAPDAATSALAAPADDAATPSAVPSPGARIQGADDEGGEELGAGGDELENMRALEAVSIDVKRRAEALLRLHVTRLGYGTGLRDRLEEAWLRAEVAGDELPFALDPVTDPASFDVGPLRARYDIPVEMNALVAQYVRFFQGDGRRWFRRWMGRATRYIPLIQPILERKGLPRDLVYLAMIESGFSVNARSWARAVGPWQFIAPTARIFKLREDFWVDERKDPIKATEAAADYLALLYEKLGDWYLAWAGYNAGGGRVRALIERTGKRDFWELASVSKGFAKETRHYVPKLIACALVAKHPELFGFSNDEFAFEPLFEFDEIELSDALDLEVAASLAGVSAVALRELNPELKRWATPPATARAPYRLRVPKGRGGAFREGYAKLPASERLHFQVHRVTKGDTLSRIAERYHSAAEAIMRLNGLRSVRMLRLHSDLIIPVPSPQALQAGRASASIERQVSRARRAGVRATSPAEEIPAGTTTGAAGQPGQAGGTVRVEKVEGKTRVRYGVAKGDSLWTIARRFDVSTAELREWNQGLASSRSLRVGTSLIIWPGQKFQLAGAASNPPAASGGGEASGASSARAAPR